MTRTLHITIGTRPNRTGLEETLASIDDGEEVDPNPSRLSIESLATVGRIFRPTNLELLEAIVEHEPASIRELARIVDRHPPEVTENVHELADYGLIALEDEGRAKRRRSGTTNSSSPVPLDGLDTDSDASVAP